MTQTKVGVVIKKEIFEADNEIITILTRDELLSFIALGTRKITSKNRVALDLGNLISAELFMARLQGRLSKLKKATLVQQPPIKSANTAEIIFEIINKIQWIEKPSTKLFNAFVKSYNHLGQEYNQFVRTFIMYNYLDSLGINPVVDKCIECNRPDRISGFEFYKGGFTCAWHTTKERSLDFLRAIKYLTSDFDKYKEVNPLIDLEIYNEIIKFMKEN